MEISLKERLSELAGRPVKAGDTLELTPDVIVVSDMVSKGCLDQEKAPKNPSSVEIVIEHGLPSVIPTGDHHRDMVRYASQYKTVLNHGDSISYYDLAKRKEKGEDIKVAALCGSRSPMLGMEGILGVQVTPAQMADVIQGGAVSYEVPETAVVSTVGKLPEGLSARNAAMKLVSVLKQKIKGKCLILRGTIHQLSLNQKLEFANYLSSAGIVNAWLEEEPEKESIYTLDFSRTEEMIALPGDMANVIPLSQLEGSVPFRLAFIGGCGGGTIEDLRAAAAYLKGKTVAYGMRLVVGPVDRETYLMAAKEGLISQMIEAGAVFMNPGCLGCTGISCGTLGDYEISLSTGSVNTEGCCGLKTSKVYLASAKTVARGAVSGIISKELEEKV